MLDSAYKKFVSQKCMFEINSARRISYPYNVDSFIEIQICRSSFEVNLCSHGEEYSKGVLFIHPNYYLVLEESLSLPATLYRSLRRLYWTDHI